MNTTHYKYEQPRTKQSPPITTLEPTKNAGHGDHWAIVSHDFVNDLPAWLETSLQSATVPEALANCKTRDNHLLISTNDTCHIKQILSLENGTPKHLLNVFPAVNSPYGMTCRITAATVCDDTQDAILHLSTPDGTMLYAFDQLYSINHCHYDSQIDYYVNFSAWAYNFTKSNQDEVILVDDPASIRYHRAFNDVVAANNGQVPHDLDARIKAWRPDSDEPLAPVEINLGHSCIYLFGETHGQQDEAWCQGQVLGKSHTDFFGQDITLFDVVILREPDADPFVVRIATPTTDDTAAIEVQDYIQANIWLQAAIYASNQKV
ncbi:MAG: hypothetical protein Q4G13_07775 [Moraxella sp.]|nr:hypothetical protein [Moraxella sp.]